MISLTGLGEGMPRNEEWRSAMVVAPDNELVSRSMAGGARCKRRGVCKDIVAREAGSYSPRS